MAEASSSSASTSESILNRLETVLAKKSVSALLTQPLLEELHSRLSEQADQARTQSTEIEASLYADPFPLLNMLFPLLRFDKRKNPLAASAHNSLLLVSRWSNPREIVIGLEEKLAAIKLPEDTDDEDEQEDQYGPFEARDAALSLVTFMEMYALCLPSIKAKRPLNFVSTAVETLVSALSHVVWDGAFPPPNRGRQDEDSAELDELALDIFEGVLHLIERLMDSEFLKKDNDWQISILNFQALLENTVGLFHEYAALELASNFFLSRYPTYRHPSYRDFSSPRRERLWQRICQSLNYDLSHMLRGGCPPPQNTGSFVLLVHYLALDNLDPSTKSIDFADSSPNDLLSATMGLIRAPFQGEVAGQLGEDEILFWMWWCVDRQLQLTPEEGIEERVLFPLVEILSALSALSPAPQSRWVAFRLLSRLVVNGVGSPSHPSSEQTQLVLLKELVEECKFDPLRVAATGLVKEVMMDKFQRAASDPAFSSLFLSPFFFQEFAPTLFRFDPSDLLQNPLNDLSAEAFAEKHHRDVVQKLGLYYFLLVRDRENKTLIDKQTGLHSPSSLTSTKTYFLAPLHAALARWLDGDGSACLNPSTRMELQVVREALGRVDEAVAKKESGGSG
ncbi:hypothetical protein JCM21900_002442 [Sporobolomyces salmonicolor]